MNKKWQQKNRSWCLKILDHVTPPSKPHAGLVEHTHPNYRNELPNGTIKTGVSGRGEALSRQDIIDATRPGAQRTGAR
jgi:hypothetical protein